MLVTIITVAYNSERTIRKTIESVLRQTYHHMEYLIIDGASQDSTVEIARGYSEQMEEAGITFQVISEKDNGIYDAMNKGIALASGDVIGIINSDDWYEQDAIGTAVDMFQSKGCDLMFGNIRLYKNDTASFVKKAKIRKFQTSRDWNHPTMFVRATIYKEYPFRDLGIHDDYGFYLQVRKEGMNIMTVDKVLANFTLGGASNHKSFKEARRRIMDRYRYCYRINGYSRWYIVECVMIEGVKMLLG